MFEVRMTCVQINLRVNWSNTARGIMPIERIESQS